MSEGNFISQLRFNWTLALKDVKFKRLFYIALVLLFSLIGCFNIYFQWVQRRHGVLLNDRILALFTPVDLSVPIYCTINGLITISMVFILKNPVRFVHTLYAYVLVSTFRMITIYLTPLEPPAGIIPLNDPFLMEVTYRGVMVTKDLFFSGHTATMVLILIAVEQRWLKWILFFATLFVATGIIIMRAHYSADVFAAPVFTVLAWQATKVFLQKVGSNQDNLMGISAR